MSEKTWINFSTEINGLPQDLKFSADAVENIFKPFLRKLSELQAITDRKIVAYIAAPPGTGKTSLAKFLEKLSREEVQFTNIRALGTDGYHYSAEYLKANTIDIDGEKILLNDIKGAPETFDVDTLQTKLREVRQEGTDWNIDIILLEGNYLLLKDSHWTNIRVLADYTVFIQAEENILRERLISRKQQGGLSREDAENFYHNSDGKNVKRVLENSASANETWQLQADGDFIKFDDEDEEVVIENALES